MIISSHDFSLNAIPTHVMVGYAIASRKLTLSNGIILYC